LLKLSNTAGSTLTGRFTITMVTTEWLKELTFRTFKIFDYIR
jgi:hypothetical protein